jgi:hypothetical protein
MSTDITSTAIQVKAIHRCILYPPSWSILHDAFDARPETYKTVVAILAATTSSARPLIESASERRTMETGCSGPPADATTCDLVVF